LLATLFQARPMVLASSFQVTPSENGRLGAFVSFPYDRELVLRFREAFPRARWRDDEACWFVPGTTAARRLDLWIARELDALDRHADAKGRDSFTFDPIESPYLLVGDDLGVRTPYSRTVVEVMRAIPWARWDPERRLWRVPFRSYDDLRRRWPEIEAAARRNEPEARRKRLEERKGRDRGEAARLQAERRLRRYPVPAVDPPPLGRPVSTFRYGVVVFEEIGTEPVDRVAVATSYPHLREERAGYVWARWRMPTLTEAYATWPARHPHDPEAVAARGWWRPNRTELQERRRTLRAVERARRSRISARAPQGNGETS
jgi:hypothetical protein